MSERKNTANSPTVEQILACRDRALAEGQFVPYYQPQYDYSSSLQVGVEALMRWEHPELGLIPPKSFIPLFEKDGFITAVDLAIFRRVCAFLRRCLDIGKPVIPVSVNISRKDITVPDFPEKLEEIRREYDIPVKYIRFEITETSSAAGIEALSRFIRKLHEVGYTVEMDDFGSGLSSLNALKELDFDMIKLDMNFMRGDITGGKAGIIISSVVRMCRWLGLPVIAEGVKNVQQADFLRSLGCDYIQSFLYSDPLPEDEYLSMLERDGSSPVLPQMSLIDNMNAGAFWSPESLETLIFNNYVGGAAVFEYDGQRAEVLRVNKKFLQELGMNVSEHDVVSSDHLALIDDSSRADYLHALERAAETDSERECEVWCTLESPCCGTERICLRVTVRAIGKSPVSTLYYEMIRNITAEKTLYSDMQDTQRRFMAASEQANIYFWEYNIATKDMRPCFRCMRDLGLPPLVRNYPEPAIELGIFPQDYADMYRDWHRQLAEGVKTLEAVIPLTVGRVPFLVRYTNEFDELGRPVKAYGSATLVVK